MPASAVKELPVLVDIAQNGLSVRVSVRPDRPLKALDAPLIVAHLARLGIILSARGEAEIHELCRPRKSGHIVACALVAVGTAAVDDVPPHLNLLPSITAAVFETPQVKAGEPVATLVARQIGRDGIDVFGKLIPRRKAPAELIVDPSLSPSADGNTYHAAIDGVVRVRGEGVGKTIAVLPCLVHQGDFAGGSLQSPGEISVRGNIKAATLKAGGAIHVLGDLENSTAICDADLTARKMRGANIDVAENCIASEVYQSRIACGGELNVENGSVVGGHVIAAGGLRCKSLGAPLLNPGTKTIVEIGTDDRVRQRMRTLLPEIEAKLAKATKIRQTVEPLLRSPQSLTPQQQLRVGALMGEADALDEQAATVRRQLRAEFDSMLTRCRNEISIAQIVHPGVTIRFPAAQTTIRIAITGPCKIILETQNGQPRILLVKRGSGPIPLDLNTSSQDWRDAAKQLAA